MELNYKELDNLPKPIQERISEPQRATRQLVFKMLDLLKKRGYKVRIWIRYDKPQYRIKVNQWEYFCRSHKEAWSFLVPFYRQELINEYNEIMQKKVQRLKQE